MNHRREISRCLLLLLVLSAGCKKDDMATQPKFRPYEPDEFFADGASARPLVAGVVPRNDPLAPGHPYFTSQGAFPAMHDPSPAAGAKIPFTVTPLVMRRGQERFDIYCSVCHGRLGNGLGMIVQRGFTPPPSFHIDRLRQSPDSHFYDVITNGYGTMYSYNDRVAPEDRWAIVAYVRALQRLDDATGLTAQDRKTLYGSGNGVHSGEVRP